MKTKKMSNIKYGTDSLKTYDSDRRDIKKLMEEPRWYIFYNELITETPLDIGSKSIKELAMHGFSVDNIDNYVYHQNGRVFPFIHVFRYKTTILSEGRFIREMVGLRELNKRLSETAFRNLCEHVLNTFELCPLGARLSTQQKYLLIDRTAKAEFRPHLFPKTYKWDYKVIKAFFNQKIIQADLEVDGCEVDIEDGLYMLSSNKIKQLKEDYAKMGIEDITIERVKPLPYFYGKNSESLARSFIQRKQAQINSENELSNIYEAMLELREDNIKITYKSIGERLGKSFRAFHMFLDRCGEKDLIREQMDILNDEIVEDKVNREIGNYMSKHGKVPSVNVLRSILEPPKPQKDYLKSKIDDISDFLNNLK